MTDLPTLHVALNEENFRTLVGGGTVTLISRNGQYVQIILYDIGFHRMKHAVEEAEIAGVEAGYRDASFPEQNCDCCGAPYRGPTVYCSRKCALGDW